MQNPWAWLGAVVLVLPVLVHLFTRRQARVEPFPSLRFIEVSRLVPTRSTRLTDIPLLLLRLLLLLLAVAALARPSRPGGDAATSAAPAMVFVLDTGRADFDSIQAARLIATADRLDSVSRAPRLRLFAQAPREVLDGAVAWIESQGGYGHIAIVSDFRRGALDSLDVAAIPSGIGLSFQPFAPAPGRGDAVPRDRDAASAQLRWITEDAAGESRSALASGARGVEAVRRAVTTLGGVALVDASRAASSPSPAGRHVVVVQSTADSAAPLMNGARPLATAWMGDLVAMLARDTTLVSAAARVMASDVPTVATDTSFVPFLRDGKGSPLLYAAQRDSMLLLVSHIPAAHLASAALLLGVSQALVPVKLAVPTSDASATGWWETWDRAAVPDAARSTVQGEANAASWARVLWLLVLLGLAAEYVVRRRWAGASA